MKLATLFAATLITAGASAQTFTDPANLRGERPRPSDGRELPVDQGAKGLQQLLRKLNTRASLMLIVAHPDDEDGGMLTLYSRGFGARVAMLTLNRGEGGQNAMTGDFEDALGLLRTQELLAADRYFNVDQMFGTEVDFGFSKTKEEAFAKWTHDRVLYDAVRAVRIYRPLVIAAVFIGGVTDGHGQHQVSGQIAQEVFNAAGDPKVFPELTAEGILPWQPLKVYARVPMQSITAQGLFDYATGQYTPARFTNYVTREVTTTQPSVDVVVHEGTPDPLLDGKSYVQFARIGLGLQRSQIGPGVRNAPSGAFDISYHRYGSKLPNQPAHEDSFFDGIDTSIRGILSLVSKPSVPLRDEIAKLDALISSATKNYDPAHPQSIAPVLADALKEIQMEIFSDIQNGSIIGNAVEKENVLHEIRNKEVQLEAALALALSIRVEATAQSPEIVVGARTPLHLQIEAPSTQGLKIFPTSFTNGFNKDVFFCLPDGTPQPFGSAVTAPFVAPMVKACTLPSSFTKGLTRPYFSRPNIEQPVYDLRNPELRAAPQTPPALLAGVLLEYRGAHLDIETVVLHNQQPVQIVPAASLTLSAHAEIVPNNYIATRFSAFLWPTELAKTAPSIKSPAGWKTILAIGDTAAPGQIDYEVHIPPSAAPSTLRASLQASGTAIIEGFRSIGYGDLPRTNYYTPATVRIVPVDLKLPTRTRIAYLPGTGDSIPDALASINLKPTILTLTDLTPANLAQYDTVLLGVRTYNAHPDLHGAPTQALFDYARNGGNVIVQFQTAEFTSADAPYPLTLGRAEVVVDETAPVQLLEPSDQRFTTPNRITPADFNNWVEERGHGFLRTWDPHYTALTETHDPGQSPQRGGLITTQLGKGHWTYCAFALYRQLPEAIPGAFRLFANLLNP